MAVHPVGWPRCLKALAGALLLSGIGCASEGADYVTIGTRWSNTNLFAGQAAQFYVWIDTTTAPTNKVNYADWDVLWIATNLIGVTDAYFPVGAPDFFNGMNMYQDSVANRIDSTVDSALKLDRNTRTTDYPNYGYDHAPTNRVGVLGVYDCAIKQVASGVTTNLSTAAITIRDGDTSNPVFVFNTLYDPANPDLPWEIFRTNDVYTVRPPQENVLIDGVAGGRTNRFCRVADTNCLGGLDAFDHPAFLPGSNEWNASFCSVVGGRELTTDGRGPTNEGVVRAEMVIEKSTNALTLATNSVTFSFLNNAPHSNYVHTARVFVDGAYTTNGAYEWVGDLRKDSTNGVVRVDLPALFLPAGTNRVVAFVVETDRRAIAPGPDNEGPMPVSRQGTNLFLSAATLPGAIAHHVIQRSTNLVNWDDYRSEDGYVGVSPSNFGGVEIKLYSVPMAPSASKEFWRVKTLPYEPAQGVVTP